MSKHIGKRPYSLKDKLREAQTKPATQTEKKVEKKTKQKKNE